MRPLRASDGEILLGWQQDPRVRRYFRNPQPVSKAQHAAWMDKRLADRAGNVMLVLLGDSPAGMARLDQKNPGVYEVSILVDPDKQGRGIGKAALAGLRKLRPGAIFEAQVMAQNAASVALFLAAGYVPENHKYIQRPTVKALFRADAAISIGGGHVMRCLTLANVLSQKGWACAFATGPETCGVVAALAQGGHRIIELSCPPSHEADAIAQELDNQVDWLIVDHYQRDATFETACRPWANNIFVLDDLADRNHDCDLLMDQSPDRTQAHYRDLTNTPCTFLLGPRYALLSPQFANTRETSPGLYEFSGGVRKVMVSLGAVDAGNRTSSVLQALALVTCEIQVDVVFGPAAPHIDEIRQLVGSLPFKTKIHTDVRDMAAMMASADLAIGAGGTTSWERCCLGLASIIIVAADNQQAVASSLQGYGAAQIVDGRTGISTKALGQMIEDLLADPQKLQSMAKAAWQVCDGRGADRVFSAMAGVHAQPGGQAHL